MVLTREPEMCGGCGAARLLVVAYRAPLAVRVAYNAWMLFLYVGAQRFRNPDYRIRWYDD